MTARRCFYPPQLGLLYPEMASSSPMPSSASAVTLLLVLGLVLYISISCFINYRKLSQFKGPPLAAVSGLWLWKQSLSKRMHIAQAEVLQKYGNEEHPTILATFHLTRFVHRLPSAHRPQPTCNG